MGVLWGTWLYIRVLQGAWGQLGVQGATFRVNGSTWRVLAVKWEIIWGYIEVTWVYLEVLEGTWGYLGYMGILRATWGT